MHAGPCSEVCDRRCLQVALDVARGLVVLPNSPATNPSGYVLDLYGGLHAFGLAQPVSGPYWPNWDIARGAADQGLGSGARQP